MPAPLAIQHNAVVGREDAVFPGGQEDMAELQPLTLVHGHHLDGSASLFIRPRGGQRRVIEQIPGGVEAASEADQFLDSYWLGQSPWLRRCGVP